MGDACTARPCVPTVAGAARFAAPIPGAPLGHGFRVNRHLRRPDSRSREECEIHGRRSHVLQLRCVQCRSQGLRRSVKEGRPSRIFSLHVGRLLGPPRARWARLQARPLGEEELPARLLNTRALGHRQGSILAYLVHGSLHLDDGPIEIAVEAQVRGLLLRRRHREDWGRRTAGLLDPRAPRVERFSCSLA